MEKWTPISKKWYKSKGVVFGLLVIASLIVSLIFPGWVGYVVSATDNTIAIIEKVTTAFLAIAALWGRFDAKQPVEL